VGGLPAAGVGDARMVTFPPDPPAQPDTRPASFRETICKNTTVLFHCVSVCSLPDRMPRLSNTSKTQTGSKKRLLRRIPYLQIRAKRRERQSDVFSQVKTFRAKALSLTKRTLSKLNVINPKRGGILHH